jgi:hypothetical protein
MLIITISILIFNFHQKLFRIFDMPLPSIVLEIGTFDLLFFSQGNPTPYLLNDKRLNCETNARRIVE